MDYILTNEKGRKWLMGNVKWKGMIGKERQYNSNFKEEGIDVVHWEIIPLQKDEGISIKILNSNYSRAIQGFRFAIDSGPGMLEYKGEMQKEFLIWENELLNNDVKIIMRTDNGLLGFYNVFYEPPKPNPAIPYGYRSLTDFSGMLVEQLDDNRYLYRSHGMEKTSDFDCLVFELEILKR